MTLVWLRRSVGRRASQSSRVKEYVVGRRHRQVVLEREGLWLHRARGWRGRFRPLLRNHDGRLQVADRGSEGRVRGRAGPQGRSGRERAGDLGFPFRNRVTRAPGRGPVLLGGSAPIAITRDDVLHVAKLAELGLTEEEIERLEQQLNAILEAVGVVSALALDDLPAVSDPL